MSNIRWKENKVISIKITDEMYVIAQMLVSPYLMIFNYFYSDTIADNTNLDSLEVLMYKGVTSQFIKSTNIKPLRLAPYSNPTPPNDWILLSGDSFVKKLWEGTEDQIEVLLYGDGGGSLIEKDIYKKEFNLGTKKLKDANDAGIDKILETETTSLAVNPAFKERLKLCYVLKKNVDPEKELIFNLPLKTEYKTYFNYLKRNPC